MRINEITSIIIDECIKIHRDLGPGLFESVYEEVICHCLAERGLNFRRQFGFPVMYNGVRIDKGFKADIIVEDKC